MWVYSIYIFMFTEMILLPYGDPASAVKDDDNDDCNYVRWAELEVQLTKPYFSFSFEFIILRLRAGQTSASCFSYVF